MQRLAMLPQFLVQYETLPLVYAVFAVLLSGAIERLAERTVALDAVLMDRLRVGGESEGEARAAFFEYSRDVAWRIGLLTASLSSALTILVLVVGAGFQAYLMPVLLLALVPFSTLCLLVWKQNTREMSKPIFWRVSGYLLGTGGVVILNLIVLVMNFEKFAEPHL